MTSARDESRDADVVLPDHRVGWWEALVGLRSALVLVLDETGTILYANPASEDILGYRPDELTGRRAFDLVHPDDADDVVADFADRLAAHGPDLPTRFRALAGDGRWRHVEAYVANVRDEPGAGAFIVHARDITPEVEAEAALRHSEERFRTLVQRSGDFIAVVGVDGSLRYASPALEDQMGFSGTLTPTVEEAIERLDEDDRELARGVLEWTLAHRGPSSPVEVHVRSLDGGWRIMEVVVENLVGNPAVRGIVVNARDVTERHRTRQLLEAQASLLEGVTRHVPLVDTLVGVAAVVEQHLPEVFALFALFEPDQELGILVAPTVPDAVLAALREHFDAGLLPMGQGLRDAGQLVFADTAEDPLWASALPLLGEWGPAACWIYPVVSPEDDRQIGLLALMAAEPGVPTEDVARVARWAVHLASIAVERRRSEDLLVHQALHDDLTGLPNRTLLLDRIDQALARARRHETDVAVLFIDLDQFKVINDSMGHARGDELLAQVAKRLVAAVPPDDTVGRFGGDEFVVVGEGLHGDAGAVALAERITEALHGPFTLAGDEVTISGSIGIERAELGRHLDPAALVRNADAAMYRAKEQGRGTHAVFEQALHDRMVERMFLERDLRQAVERGELELHYQPVVDLASAAVVGLEALLRWNRPDHGLVAPGDFIPVAEDTGLIVPIGRWVLGEVCRQARLWRDHPVLGRLRMSANLSARQLADPHLVEVVGACLTDNGLAPARLALEVTESAVVDDLEVAQEMLTRLHALGVAISIDDFGTGWASLDYVRRFTVADELKIDRAFIADLESGTRADEAIVSASIVLAGSLGLDVVAEGVESRRQFDTLRRLGCAKAQGFLFSRPVPVGDLAAVVGSFRVPS